MAVLRRSITEPRQPAEYTPDIAARDAMRLAENKTLKLKPFDVIGLATSIGLVVDILPLSNDIPGFLKREGNGWKIGVNSLHHPNRRRFTVAHELGHYFLHRSEGDFEDTILFRRDYQVNRREREANEFASKLLMPTSEFRRELAVNNYDISSVARVFGVSGAAAEFRHDSVDNEIAID
jgi:Zn-dependent peptidase ImmA (M78 family)